LHGISPDKLYEKIRAIIKEVLRQAQLLTRERALKIAGISNATLEKAINEGMVKPQLIKDRKHMMNFESEILKIQKRRKTSD
jgi:hypothetical protein